MKIGLTEILLSINCCSWEWQEEMLIAVGFESDWQGKMWKIVIYKGSEFKVEA